jgi:hypothetical protein
VNNYRCPFNDEEETIEATIPGRNKKHQKRRRVERLRCKPRLKGTGKKKYGRDRGADEGQRKEERTK